MPDKTQLKFLPIENIYPYAENPRIISDKSLEILCQSLRDNPDYFQARPLIISDRTKKLVVIAGNQRLRAAHKIGLNTVPCVILSGLTQSREKEICIRDNISNGEWNLEQLKSDFNLSELKGWGLSVPKINLEEKLNPILEDDGIELPENFDRRFIIQLEKVISEIMRADNCEKKSAQLKILGILNEKYPAD